MPTLRSSLIRLASANPELRPHLLPLLKKEAKHEKCEDGTHWSEGTHKCLAETAHGHSSKADKSSQRAKEKQEKGQVAGKDHADAAQDHHDAAYFHQEAAAKTWNPITKSKHKKLQQKHQEDKKYHETMANGMADDIRNPNDPARTDKTAADKLDIVCMGMANRLADIITSVDDDELNEIPAKLTGILTAVKLMQSELERNPTRGMDLVVALSTALSSRLKVFL